MLDLSLNHILRICTVSRRCHEKVYNKAFWDFIRNALFQQQENKYVPFQNQIQKLISLSQVLRVPAKIVSQVGLHFGTKVPLNPNSSIFDWCWDHLELSYNITWRGTYKVALIFAFMRHPTMHMSYNLSFFSIDVLRTCCLV